jgi:hypothetical protein
MIYIVMVIHMRKNKYNTIIESLIVLVLLIPTTEAATTPQKIQDTTTVSDAYTHTVVALFGTATFCYYCQFAHAALKNIYAGQQYPFSYVTLVGDKNKNAFSVLHTEFGFPTGCYAYPDVFFDGGFRLDLGASSTSNADAKYRTSIPLCGNRPASNITSTLSVGWLGNARINIALQLQNNEQATYQGRLRIYVTEITTSMGWLDDAGYPYTFPFLDYAKNQNISISAGSVWSGSLIWDGNTHTDGYGNTFGSITSDNLMVIAAVYNSTPHLKYSFPPNTWPFNAYYTDAAIAVTPTDNNEPPATPHQPTGPTSGETYIQYNFSTSTTDSNPGDQIRYGWDWNNDNTIDEWTAYSPSGIPITTHHKFTIPGIYQIRVQANDTYGSTSGFSVPLTVHIEGGLYNLTVKTDHQQYLPGDTVTMTGRLTKGGTGIQGIVCPEVKDPTNETIFSGNCFSTNNDGNYNISFPLSTDAIPGIYNVRVVCHIEDNELLATTSFIVIDRMPPTIIITKPEKALYAKNIKIMPFFTTVILGSIEINVDASDDQTGMNRVEFYIDNSLKTTVTDTPYTWIWNEKTPFRPRHIITVFAYDNAGNQVSEEINVLKFF